jgi:hypothetical protein
MKPHLLSWLILAAPSLPGQVWVEPPDRPMAHAAVFGGENAAFVLTVEARKPGPVTLTYSLFQIAGAGDGLAVPLDGDKPLGEPIDFGMEESREVRREIPIPAVQAPTMMVVKFFSSSAPDQKASWRNQAFLKVFPRPRPGEWAGALASAEKDSGRNLAVFGKSRDVRNFLAAQKIAFRDLGEEFPTEFSAPLLFIGEVSAEALEKHRPKAAGGRKIFFVEDAMRLPGIYETVEPSGSLTKVTLPIPERLAADPQMQTDFVDLLLRQLNPPAHEN